jgi:serine/threonine protein phosphatase PrpC
MSATGLRQLTVPPDQTEMPSIDESVMAKPPRALKVKAFGITDKGKVRPANEDQFLIAELTKAMRVWQTSLPEPKVQVGEERAHLFLVADGMGGHEAGERASALAVVAIEQFTLNTFRWFFGANSTEAQKALAQFQSALSQADARILAEAADHPELSGMGTTVTMAFHLGAQLCVVHVGDSRAYLYRDDELHQLTQDHTLMADMVRSGALRRDEVAGHRLRHVITNVVGGQEPGVKVEARAFEVQAGDRLLLCSDGLTEMVTNEAVAATLGAEPVPEVAARKLLAQANEGGASDNITLLIVRFDEADAADVPTARVEPVAVEVVKRQ